MNTLCNNAMPHSRDQLVYIWAEKKRKKKFGLHKVHIIVPDSDKSLCQMENVVEFTAWSWGAPSDRTVCMNCLALLEESEPRLSVLMGESI